MAKSLDASDLSEDELPTKGFSDVYVAAFFAQNST